VRVKTDTNALGRSTAAGRRGTGQLHESRVCQRALDVCVAMLALALLAPVFVLIAVAIRRDSPGPVLYTQARAGRARRT